MSASPARAVQALPDELPTPSTSSAHTMDHILLSSMEDKQLARQKRKRTSPEDAAVLEAAYLHDPKPDKAARQELVSRVALDEKGVQIWFQNRRQTSRRKSRPLLPHEIAQYQAARSAPFSSAPGCDLDGLDDSGIDLTSHRPASSHSHHDVQSASGRKEQASPHLDDRPVAVQSSSASGDAAVLPLAVDDPGSLQTTAVAHTDSLASIGYLANRRSASFLRQSFPEQPTLPLPMPTMALKRPHGRCSSFVRLSMNAEGNAEVVTKDASSPSPPRPQQVINSELANSVNLLPALPATRSLFRSASGRSRDSRSWEFWCDKEARSQLGYAAEKDASGSAAGAIGLLRTASSRTVLGAVPSKRNFVLSTRTPSAKRSKLDHRRGPLQRSSTSLGRLQGDVPRTLPKLKHAESTKSYAKGTESDKENWSPDSETSSEAVFRTGYGLSHPAHNLAAQEQSTIQDDSQNLTSSIQDDPERDEELATFMRGGVKKSGRASGADLDCVQGLLSLSQGNWR